MSKHVLTYSKFTGEAVGDHNSEVVARALKFTSKTVCNENVIHAFRLLIMEKFFTCNEVEVRFEMEKGKFIEINFDQDGRTHDWYEGFCDTNDKVLQGLLGWTGSTPWLPDSETPVTCNG